MFPVVVGVSGAVRMELSVGRNMGQQLVGARECSASENIKNLEEYAVSECIVRLLLGRIVVTCHSSSKLAHAHLSHSQKG
jgi:hypothetical protein